MGLDIYASRTPGDIKLSQDDLQAFERSGTSLCGGMFSGGGNDGSFRGKVYQVLILDISGISLARDWTPPELVCQIYQSLMACDPDRAAAAYGYRNTEEDILNLRKFFRVACERGLGLIGWY